MRGRFLFIKMRDICVSLEHILFDLLFLGKSGRKC